MNFHNYMKTVISGIKEWVNSVVPKFPSATPGQTIVVKAVDDTGMPTEWEAVDMPEHTWEALPDKPFSEVEVDSLVWDGTPTDVVTNERSAGGAGMKYYLVSKQLPSTDELTQGAKLSSSLAGVTDASEDIIMLSNNIYGVGNSSILFIYEDGLTASGITFPQKGIYGSAIRMPDAEDYQCIDFTLTINGYKFSEIKPIDEKFIPSTIARIEDIPEVLDEDGRLHIDMLPSGYPTLGDYGRFSVSNLLFENLNNVNSFDISLTNSAYIEMNRQARDGLSLFFTGTSKDTETVVPGKKFCIYIPEILDSNAHATHVYTCGKNLKLSSGNGKNTVHIHDIYNKPVVTFASGNLYEDGTPINDVQIRLRNVETPLENHDAANKAYVDGKISNTEIILSSSTEGSTKKFKITVDDNGTLTVAEVV